ncbi:MAG: transketolase [Gammaproteobacteria bacterium]|nr:transketolase [Gammaproteobacteria bacterium]
MANAIRALSMDAVQAAKSGHPGMPMGMADLSVSLWLDHLKHNPQNPNWFDRDRFVLSNGHGSMLIYSLLHLTGYELPLEEIKNFRQLHSKTAGHPEFGLTPGVETTTGPLGQGFANSVGLALAEKVLAARFNRPGHQIIDHYTYVFLGDGCLMEGISHEAASFSGTHRLNKLIAFYDDNNVSIDGEVSGWFTEDTPRRFQAYGWHVVENVDGHNSEEIEAAIQTAQSETGRPSLICCKTVIGWGAPNKEGTAGAHGAPLGEEEVALTRDRIGWHHPTFHIPDSIRAEFDCRVRGSKQEKQWDEEFIAYANEYPELAAELSRRIDGRLPENWLEFTSEQILSAPDKSLATRQSSKVALDAYGPILPELIGGSAELTGSNLPLWDGSKPLDDETSDGSYIYFGVREFGMSAIVNGLALHGGFVPYGATFLMFSEYARNAVRMSALMGIQSIFVYTHDSIGLGEDGPTHQAVEQAATLRLIPNMSLWRPCDTQESMVAWKVAIERTDGPTCLLFSRQGVAQNSRTETQIEQISKGGYVLLDSDGEPDIIIIATGTEVELATGAAQRLTETGIKVRVVSMPSVDVFETQSQDYRNAVLPHQITKRVIVEAGVTALWAKYAGTQGVVMGVDQFGESAPGKALYEYFGLTVDGVERAARDLLG